MSKELTPEKAAKERCKPVTIREAAKKSFDQHAIFKDNPIAWNAWKMAFFLGTEWQAQQPIKEQGWVSVREDKPSPYTTVLICFEKESKGMNNIIRTGRWCGDSFIIDGDYPLLTNIITHWQPLPEPPNNQK